MFSITLLRKLGDTLLDLATYCMEQTQGAAANAEGCQDVGCFAYWLPVAWCFEIGMLACYYLGLIPTAILRLINKTILK